MSRSHFGPLLIAASLALGCAAEVGEVDLASDALTVAPSDVTRFDDDATHRIAARYGRAVARIDIERPDGTSAICPAFLINDRTLVSSANCRGTDRSHARVPAFFGRYGAQEGGVDFPDALSEARVRLYERGFPIDWVFDPEDGPTAASLTRFTCDFLGTDYLGDAPRRLDYWECRPNTLRVTAAPFARERSLALLPGHLYGHFEIEADALPVGTDISAIGYGATPSTADRAVLFSPNGRTVALTGTGSTGAFELSGNVPFDTGVMSRGARPRLRGIVTGTVYHPRYQHDIGVAFGALAVARAQYGDGRWATLPRVGSGVTPWLGGSGGTLRALDCPADFAASGVIYSVESGVVGNLGVVCEPFQRGTTDAGADVEIGHALTQAVVIGGGSIGTGIAAVNRVDFNTYWHEVLDPARGEPQHTLLCPPGSYLAGLRATADTLVRGIAAIECRELVAPTATRAAIQRSAEIRPFGLGSGSSTARESDCSAQALATGIRVRAGYFTDGVQLACTQLYPALSTFPGIELRR